MEEAFGIIPLRKTKSGFYILLIKSKNGNFWGIPKGHGNMGESQKDSATRELKEETNLDIVKYLTDEPIIETYQYKKDGQVIDKKVVYFLAEVQGEIKIQGSELLECSWVSLEEGERKVTYPATKAIFPKIREKLFSV